MSEKRTTAAGGEHWMKVQTTDIAMSNSPCSLKRLPETGDLVPVEDLDELSL